MPELPSGTVTFLVTDIEGSTALWERDRAAVASASLSLPGFLIYLTSIPKRMTRV